ncbi:enoyl-CoA hydratase/isomerase family protein [Pelagibacterium montanilacus]|uniref:enoyl-CoA hydratase/isomerase family protein n=1 Tax=Pelagibacterium montanilacus TaxID=2185280 RepID=UPI000F8C9791|nr:enoyl-CoA hydratase/isomerase family protein [Pelagibacterium montanilacus]
MADPRIGLSLEGHIAILTFARPDKLNAFDLDMLRALSEACDAAEASSARALVLTGSGKAFSAGGDITAWAAMAPNAFGHDWVRMGHRVLSRLAGLRMPVVAALNGHALGGGLEIAAAADIRIAQTGIKIGLPETGLGMVPGWSGTQRLVTRFGARLVRRMALGGEVFSAEEALALGIVDKVVEPGEARSAAIAYAEAIAARGPAATETAKLMIAAASGEDAGAAVEALGSMLVAGTADLKEGVAAFTGKRAPDFRGEW